MIGVCERGFVEFEQGECVYYQLLQFYYQIGQKREECQAPIRGNVPGTKFCSITRIRNQLLKYAVYSAVE